MALKQSGACGAPLAACSLLLLLLLSGAAQGAEQSRDGQRWARRKEREERAERMASAVVGVASGAAKDGQRSANRKKAREKREQRADGIALVGVSDAKEDERALLDRGPSSLGWGNASSRHVEEGGEASAVSESDLPADAVAAAANAALLHVKSHAHTTALANQGQATAWNPGDWVRIKSSGRIGKLEEKAGTTWKLKLLDNTLGEALESAVQEVEEDQLAQVLEGGG